MHLYHTSSREYAPFIFQSIIEEYSDGMVSLLSIHGTEGRRLRPISDLISTLAGNAAHERGNILAVEIEDMDIRADHIMKPILEWHDKALKASNPIVIHCQFGQSRSTAMAIGLMMREGATMEEAFEGIRAGRQNPAMSHTKIAPDFKILAYFEKMLKIDHGLLRRSSMECFPFF